MNINFYTKAEEQVVDFKEIHHNCIRKRFVQIRPFRLVLKHVYMLRYTYFSIIAEKLLKILTKIL